MAKIPFVEKNCSEAMCAIRFSCFYYIVLNTKFQELSQVFYDYACHRKKKMVE